MASLTVLFFPVLFRLVCIVLAGGAMVHVGKPFAFFAVYFVRFCRKTPVFAVIDVRVISRSGKAASNASIFLVGVSNIVRVLLAHGLMVTAV